MQKKEKHKLFLKTVGKKVNISGQQQVNIKFYNNMHIQEVFNNFNRVFNIQYSFKKSAFQRKMLKIRIAFHSKYIKMKYNKISSHNSILRST